MDAFRTFRGLPASFHEQYFEWHSSGQYQGAREFSRVDDVLRTPPLRERDDWYSEELRVIDQHYRQLSTSSMLEIGCGDGNLTWKLARQSKSLVACDLDPAAVALTRKRLS